VSLWRPEPLLLALPDDLPMAEAVVALALRVEALRPRRSTRVACVVPAPFVRYVLVPWNAAMQGRKARQVFAEHCFRETYGELAREWVVRVDPGRFGHATLACAMNVGLLDELARVFQASGLVLESVQPALMNAFNALPTRLAAGSTWIVVPGSGTLTLLLVEDGRPLRVALVAGSVEQMEACLRREWFALGREGTWSHVRVCPAAPNPQALAA